MPHCRGSSRPGERLQYFGNYELLDEIAQGGTRVLPIAGIMIGFQIGGLLWFEGEKKANDHLIEFMLGVSFGLSLMLSAFSLRRK